MKRKKKKAVSGFTRKALACALAYVFAFSAISPSYAMAAEMAAPAVATVDASIDQPAATIVDGHKESADSLEDDAVGGQDDQAISAENGLEDVEGAGASEPVKAPESHAVTSSTNVSKESLAQDNEQTVSIKWRDTGDDMISIGDDDSLSVDIDETREYSDLSVGVIVEWTSSGSKDYEPGEVEIGIPDHLFMGRDGEPYETVYELIYGTVPVATAKTGLEVDLGVPEAPEKSADGWQYRHDEDSHEYIIVNADHVGAGTKFVCEVNYNYSTAGGYYYGLTYDDKVHYVLSELTNDPVYLYAQINGSDKKQIGPATIETHSDLDSVEVEMEGAYDDWKPAWGIQEPSSPGQSLYVVWRVSALYAYAYQPHNLNLNAGNAPMGEIIGISDVWQWNDYKAGTGLDPEACVFNEPSNANTSIGNAERGSGGEGLIASIAILVRYDKDAIDAMNGIVELTLSAEAIMETADWGDQSVEGSGLFTYQPLGFDAPPGNAFKLKQATGAPELVESSLYFYQEGQVERLENGLATATGVDTSAAYASCLGATLGEGLDPTNIVNYGKRSYTVELVNDSAYIDDTRLGPDEYEMSAVLDINSVAVTLYEGVPDYEAGQYTTRPIEGSINPLDVTLYVQNGGEGVWVPAARWTQTENSLLDCAAIEPLAEGVEIREFDPASVIDLWYSSDKLSAYDGKQRCDIILPEGTTGVKIGFETTAWAASIGDMDPGHSDPQYGLTVASSILASERLQAHAASSTTVGCYKASTLVAHDDNGVLLGFQG